MVIRGTLQRTGAFKDRRILGEGCRRHATAAARLGSGGRPWACDGMTDDEGRRAVGVGWGG